MKQVLKHFAVAVMIILFAGSAFAAQGIVETFTEGCKKEIDNYCKDVTPGEGRVLACLFAREDKLSTRCEYAIYDAAAQLERVIAAIAYVANECKDDLKNFCSGVKAGEGRLLSCIEKNKDKISGRCSQAVKDVKKK